ncbi:hypothetical protein EG327_006513 [Venturia inaequalis]|uniref:Uncharacterized protein n=1 Tax=Venturia inaequalis TaxID=5025 RepID=A0A8H3V041_VENIN|nr:hypothetical protein EG327_006513 [Venturia inaequalis]
MSSSARDADGQGHDGRERRLHAGKAFIKRIAYRMRGGSATTDMSASPLASAHADPTTDPVLDVEEDRAPPSDPEAIATPTHDIDSDVPQIPSQIDPNPKTISVTYSRGAERHERTRRLLAKYGLSVEAQEWMPATSNPPMTVLRVEKQIRMRIRYTCHLCERLFGADRNCKTCNHKRCEECSQHPPKRSKNREETNKEISAKSNLAINTDVVTLRKREHEDVEAITRSCSRGKRQASEDAPIPVLQLLQHRCHKCDIAFEQRADFTGKGEDQLRPERVHRPPRLRIRPKKVKLDHEENNETIQDRVRVPGIS